MNLEVRLSKLEATAGCKQGWCECLLIEFIIGLHGSDFFTSCPQCNKPIDREATHNPDIYESRVLLPGYDKSDRDEVFAQPSIEGRRLVVYNFSGGVTMAEDGKF